MTLLTVATAALEMRLAGRFVGVTGGFRRLQVLGGVIMTGESAVQGVRDKDFVDGFGAQMLGGALGGAPWTVLETGLAGARARWNEDSVYQTWLDDHNTVKGELTSVELNWADVTTVSLHDSEKYWNDLINSGKDFDAARQFKLRMLRDLKGYVLPSRGPAPQ